MIPINIQKSIVAKERLLFQLKWSIITTWFLHAYTEENV